MSTYFLTAETERGRRAIEEVMAHSYEEDIDRVPPEWAFARIVDDVAVSFAMVQPNERLSFANGAIRHGFLRDIATREDRRHEGHFRATMQEVFDRLRLAGIPLVTTHGDHLLYRRFGFDVFTHQHGIFITPNQIARHLGSSCSQEGEKLLEIEEGPPRVPELLLVRRVAAATAAEARCALLAAAAMAERLGRTQILFEHPPVGVFARHPLLPGQASLDSPFRSLALACGAQVRLQGGGPEGRAIPDGDWIKVLDAAAFVAQAIRFAAPMTTPLPTVSIAISCDAGDLTITSSAARVTVRAGRSEGVPVVQWPSAMLAQLFTGYQSAEVLACLHGVALPADAAVLFSALLPRQWRVTRNETWSYWDPGFVVRPFTMRDWRSLWLVHLAQLAEHGVFLDPSELGDGPDPNARDEHGEWDIEFPDRVYLQGAGNYWLAWDGDLPIGSVGGQDIGGVIELRRMFVRADYRRRGVGTALVRSLIEHSRAHGARAIELWTGPDGPGWRLYQTLGFRQTEGPGPEFSLDNPTPHRYMPAPGDGQIRMRLDL